MLLRTPSTGWTVTCLVAIVSFFGVGIAQPLSAQVAATESTAPEIHLRPISELEGSTEEARMHFALAQRYYDTGRFSAAAREFRLAYELTQLGELLYNMFLAHREANELVAAIDSLERYIVQSDDEVVRRAATIRLRRLRLALAAQQPENEPSFEPPTTPNAATVTASTEEERGSEPAEPVTPIDPRPRAEHGLPAASMVGPWAMIIGGSVVALSAIVPGALALGDEAELDHLCESGVCEPGFEAVQDRGFVRAVISDTLILVGLSVAAGGVLWWLLADDDDHEPALSVSCDTWGCLGAVGGPF